MWLAFPSPNTSKTQEIGTASGVAHEGAGHLQALRWDIAHACLDVVGDPLHEVGAVLVLHVEHLLIDLLGGHAAAELRMQGVRQNENTAEAPEGSCKAWSICSSTSLVGMQMCSCGCNRQSRAHSLSPEMAASR
eukprot:scaffold155771_cov15-Tisochrysis_lutea.AAC.1